MKTRLSALFLALTLAVSAFSQVYLDPSAPIEKRVEDALGRMTLREKIDIIHAQSKFSSPGVARLGIPGLWCTDGPHGVRAEVLWDEWNTANWSNDSCTAFPALTCLAATWNPEMAALYGQVLGEEALYRGKNVLLGPGVNIYRTPLNGRNFEYMGEDPCLASAMVVPYVQSLQANGVAACVKHYALNNQEDGRHTTNVVVSDRALYELYLPAFKAAVVDGGAWSIMGSYNRYKDQFCCHNEALLMQILRAEWDFDGAVISDWGGAQNTDEAIFNGLDLEFGTWTDGLTFGASNAYDNYHLALPYLTKIQSGEVGTVELDNKVRNVLRLIFRTSMNPNRKFGSLCSEAHAQAARQIAGEGMVLLKNDPVDKKALLPINIAEMATNHSKQGAIMTTDLYYPRILVVGENAVKPLTVGGGSSSLKAKYEVSPLEGIRRRAGKEAEVKWVRGYVGEAKTQQDGMSTGSELEDNRSASELIKEAIDAAKDADIVIFVGGLNKAGHQDCEGVDRLDYALPYGQDKLITELAKANKKLVTVFISGNAFSMPWLKNVPAVVQAWFSGSEAGNALADVLFGDVNPSGKLPYSVFPSLSDYPAHQLGKRGYPGEPSKVAPGLMEEEYKEDVFVGYRYADLSSSARKAVTGKSNSMKPLFAFGHGLSYTTFTYSPAKLSGNQVSVRVTNTGDRPGKEVVQLYVAPINPVVNRPVKELKAFQKIEIPDGETVTVTFEITEEMLQRFDEEQHDWVVDPGKYDILIGPSSANTPAKVTYVHK